MLRRRMNDSLRPEWRVISGNHCSASYKLHEWKVLKMDTRNLRFAMFTHKMCLTGTFGPDGDNEKLLPEL